MSLHIVIMAAGKGTRMHSATPKVLHHLAGKPMLMHVIDTAIKLNPDCIHIIIGHQADLIKLAIAKLIPSNININWVYQDTQSGTGNAVMQALPHIPENTDVLILSGDVPCIQNTTLQNLINLANAANNTNNTNSLALLLAKVANPTGLGRIHRDDNNQILAIIEEKDASIEMRKISEIYTGICYSKAQNLRNWITKLNNNNAQKEYYLTGILPFAINDQAIIISTQVNNPLESQGINDRSQLELLERFYQKNQAQQLMLNGVTLADHSRFDLRGNLTCGKDVFIDINAIIIGNNTFGDGCIIGPNCTLKDVQLGNNCVILANSVLENCQINNNCQIGPFARLRPGTILGADCKIGNFVETKKATFGEASKASHLSYLGDVTIGNQVNIGAGTITCNYDGVNKHQTIIDDGAFIGSDSQLVAPVRVGKNAILGAGTTLRSDAPDQSLTLTPSKQRTLHGWSNKKNIKQTEK